MPLELVPNTSLQYYLINFDASGVERDEADGKKISEALASRLHNEPVTDVFIISHGWQGDIPAARRQYSKWIQAMAANEADIEALKQLRPDFCPLMIGIHWPSLPWGEEEEDDSGASERGELSRGSFIERFAQRIADTPIAREALGIIFNAAEEDDEPLKLGAETIQAYEAINSEAGLGSAGEAGAPGSDREPFDPKSIYKKTKAPEKDYSDNSFVLTKLLSPLRSLSYWKMKDRARHIGETGGAQLLQKLQNATSEEVRFHLVGHSFGCIVVSAMLAGPNGDGPQPVRPVNSLSLIQGAVSTWSYCKEIPVVDDRRPGYFQSILAQGRVNGPVITTRAEKDTAVGRLYPLASGIARSDPNFAENDQPRYGAIGAYGAMGDGIDMEFLRMRPCEESYGFEAGKIYNLEASDYICKIPPDAGLGGSHSAIDEPEVAHAVWAAAMG